MITVDIKQFKRPIGRVVNVTAQLPDQYIDAYNEMTDAGYCFEAEILLSSQVAISISNGSNNVDGVLVENGPGVTGAMEDMLLRGWWRNSCGH